MLHENPGRPDGTGTGADAGPGEWAGEKRRKHLDDPSLHRDVRTTSSSVAPPAKGDEEEDPFFTAADLEQFTIPFSEAWLIMNSMKDNNPFISVDLSSILSDELQRRVYGRLMLYRIKAHKLSKGESLDKLDDETLRKELPGFLEKEKHIPQLHFDVCKYFKCLDEEERGSVDWYFDPEFSKLEDLANYQRLVLKNHGDVEYLDWKGYRSTFTTYKMDEDYILFFAEMSRKLQWLRKYIGTKRSKEWEMDTEIRGAYQALKIAKRFPGMTVDLAYTAYREHIWSLHYDYLYREEWDIIFFQIWKLVTTEKMEFTHAMMAVKEMQLAPRHDLSMLRFLNNRMLFDLESKFDSCVEGIPLGAEDGAAMDDIKKAVWKAPKEKMLHQYMERKMSIAKEIGLYEDSSVPRRSVAGTLAGGGGRGRGAPSRGRGGRRRAA